MALPLLQIGQCGNQVGQALYSTLFQEGQKASPAHQALLSQFFTGGSQAKAMLIDMEPKVVGRCLQARDAWSYNKHWSVVREEGSGNNWAYGCYVHGPKIREELTEVLRNMTEKEDYLSGFMQVQSLAGGTGSGVGTYMLSLLSDIFPKVPRFVTCVMPHLSGEVILQAYNATLSVGTAYGLADGILVLQNDAMNKVCVQQLGIKKPQLEHINEVIARSIGALMFPVIPSTVSSLHSCHQNHLKISEDLIQEVFYDCRFKLTTLKCAPHSQPGSQLFSTDSWLSIENQLLMHPKQVKARFFIGRGQDHPLQHRTQSVPAIYDRHAFKGYDRSGVVVENSFSVAAALEQTVERTYGMLDAKAYLHQYYKHGMEQHHFEECLVTMENIVTSYKSLK